MKNSTIEWTHHTFNPWIGCTKISPACQHCYAQWQEDHRFHRVTWGPGQERRRTRPENWRHPQRWNQDAEISGQRARVFCASLADIFDGESMEMLSAWRTDLWKLIDRTPALDWLLLTKRPENVRDMVPWNDHWPPNVWLGTSVENEEWAQRRLPILSEIPAAVRFVSAEPLLGEFSLRSHAIDWVIAGGESGVRHRPSSADSFRSLRDQCGELGIAFFFKQWGGRTPKAGGRELDGQEWSELPTPRSQRLNACGRVQLGQRTEK